MRLLGMFVSGSLAVAFNLAVAADPTPLPRPDLLPLSSTSLQQIQTIGRSVVDARANQKQDPRALAMRQALLDVQGELTGRPVLAFPSASIKECIDTGCESKKSLSSASTEAAVPSSPVNTPTMLGKRQALREAIAVAEGEPALAHMVSKARELETQLAALDSQEPSEKRHSVRELKRLLTPSSTPQNQAKTLPHVIVTFHSQTTHRPLVRANLASSPKAGKKQ